MRRATVTPSPTPATDLATVHLPVGTFAARLLGHRDVPPASVVDLAALRAGPAAGTQAVVCVHSDADVPLREAVDELGARLGLVTIGVQLTPRRLVVGPVVVPGSTACWACHRRRADQHAGSARPYDLDAAVTGLEEGFAPHHVALASALLDLALEEASRTLRDGRPPSPPGGTVRTVDLVSGVPSAAATVGVDRCPRCSGRFAAERSTWRHLARATATSRTEA